MRLHLLLLVRLVSFGEMRRTSGDCSPEQCPVADPPSAINVYSAGSNPWMGGLYQILGGSPILFLWYWVDVGHRVPCCRTPVECATAVLRAVEPELQVWGGSGHRILSDGRAHPARIDSLGRNLDCRCNRTVWNVLDLIKSQP
jgi:hypothetical protein